MFEVNLVTVFPEIFSSFLSTSLIEKSIARGLFTARTIDVRTFAEPPHFQVDDSPYGGGAGMVMMPGPLVAAIESAKAASPHTRVILMSAAGKRFDQQKAEELSRLDSLTIVCGRYEGVDQRVVDLVVDEELSLGDFVLMGGEIPAMAVIEATLRLKPSVLGNSSSIQEESYAERPGNGERLLEAPHYTRPAEFRGLKVPEILLSGDHGKISRWRLEKARERTIAARPDLLAPKTR